MSLKRQMVLTAVIIALVAGVILSTPKQASAIFPLEFDWSCQPPDGVCDFEVTTTNHPRVKYIWGDGTSTGPTTDMTVQHDYAVGGGGTFFEVTVIGYSSSSGSAIDNIISCDDIEAQGSSPGGNPGAFGHCDGF